MARERVSMRLAPDVIDAIRQTESAREHVERLVREKGAAIAASVAWLVSVRGRGSLTGIRAVVELLSRLDGPTHADALRFATGNEEARQLLWLALEAQAGNDAVWVHLNRAQGGAP